MQWKNNSLTADLLRPSKRQSSNIGNLLNRTPSLPDEQKVKDVVEGAVLSLEGYSQWKITSSRCCDLTSKLKTSPRQRVNIDEFFPAWSGFEHLPNCASGGNYLAAFVLGWSYILSARLIELRKKTEDDKIIYTDKKATYHCDDTALPCDGFTIPIGNADANECRWWAAILAGDCAYYPPWACHLNPKARFNIRYEGTSHLSSGVTHPPSSGEAQQYLCNFARLHNAYDQLVAAFAGALTIPSQVRFGAPVTLPKPKVMTHTRKPGSICGTYIPSTDQLPHVMLLSCIPNVLPSCLFGCFWNPGVHCNVASEWLHPILGEILPPLIQEKKYGPSSAPLWLGSAITGMLPRIQSILSSFMPPGCPEATVWTNCCQSFMDSAFHKERRISDHATLGKVICREDEFRLLYLTDIESDRYGMLPLSPYPPFGMVKLNETALEVRLHAFCGHQLDYSHWVWRNHDRPDLIDPGKALPCEKLSEIATRNIFSWTFFSNGVRPDEMPMWRHEWLSILLDHESDDENMSISFRMIQSMPQMHIFVPQRARHMAE
ncbi:hypothetical protein CC80DRAFT_529610 [Byssothecium circinans]|uniref:Uncharacterized protein n=1 Tax=Byssothecium circinans TaxID=147558 RepID=A0A6A5T991_9PLEO|nr:hypothetical protein CC80DRAFT_529610 [Byssothecium circinans]